MDSDKLWKAVLGEFELRVSQGNFLTWFRGTKIIEKKGGLVIVATTNVFAHEWLPRKYRPDILEVLQRFDPSVQEVRFVLGSQLPRRQVLKKNSHILVHKNRLEPLFKPAVSSVAAVADRRTPTTAKTLNPKYTFDSFIVGPSNEVAHAACQAVAHRPGESYNPLFIYGGVGLGKTHLLQAIGNQLLTIKPEAKVLYTSSEKFMNDFVQALQNGTVHAFKKYYREVDVLIMDDVQFLAGKGKTQEELFHTYNALQGQNKQVILSSDRPPKAIQTFEERLSSRLAGGMIVDIKQPDLETRLAIVMEKAKNSPSEIDEDALMFLAKNIQRNVRELEGALNKLLAYGEFNKQRVTLDFAKKILEGILEKPQHKNIDVPKILEAVSTYYNLSKEDLCGKCRKQEIVRPRQIAMYLLRKESNISFPSIGNYFGGRDHTTAMHACEKITNLIGHDEDLLQEINFIREKIYA